MSILLYLNHLSVSLLYIKNWLRNCETVKVIQDDVKRTKIIKQGSRVNYFIPVLLRT